MNMSYPDMSVTSFPRSTLGRISANFRVVGSIPVLLIILVAGMVAMEPRFYGLMNVFNILRNTSFLATVACGQMLVMIVGGMDLSVGATAALASVVAAKVMFATSDVLGPTGAILLGSFASLLAGALVGLFNGLCSTLLRVPSLIVTLGTLSIVSGVTLVMTSGIPVYGMPQSFMTDFGRAFWQGIPALAYVAACVIAAVWLMQRKTVLGTHFYAIGGNPMAAMVSGIPARTYTVLSFVICGMLASLSGLLITAQMGSGQANVGGDRLMLLSIAAAVIGGTSLRGGIGRAEMVAFSALFLSTLSNALNLLRIDSKKELVVIGFLLLMAVAVDSLTRGKTIAD
jgi:ribose transport system permease protein